MRTGCLYDFRNDFHLLAENLLDTDQEVELHPQDKYRKQVLLKRARHMRKNPTPGEEAFWRMVKWRRFHRYRFRRQYVVDPYIVDFYCSKLRLVVEIVGGIHKGQQTYDITRYHYLKGRGLYILRFTEKLVTQDPGRAYKILNAWHQSPNR